VSTTKVDALHSSQSSLIRAHAWPSGSLRLPLPSSTMEDTYMMWMMTCVEVSGASRDRAWALEKDVVVAYLSR
jgi:hypothetical protein